MIHNLNLKKSKFVLSKKSFVDFIALLNWQNQPQEK
jgi:hypothetical protein